MSEENLAARLEAVIVRLEKLLDRFEPILEKFLKNPFMKFGR